MRPQTILMTSLIFFAINSHATDGYYFLDLLIKSENNELTTKWEPQKLVAYEQMADPRYELNGFMEVSFDAYIQNALVLAKALEEHRDQLKIKKKPFLVAHMIFAINFREVNGEIIERKGFDTIFYLTSDPGKIMVAQGDDRQIFNQEDILSPKAYPNFFKSLGKPLEGLKFKMPKQDQFMAEAYYSIAGIDKDLLKKIKMEGDGRKAFRALFTSYNYNQQEHLGTTYCRKQGNRLPQVRSGHLHAMREANRLYAEALLKKERGEPYTRDVEKYLSTIPSDIKAIELLAGAYINEGRDLDALELINSARPLLPKDASLFQTQKKLIAKQEKERNRLLEGKSSFKRDNNVKINIISPRANDYVGGNAKMVFDMTGHTSSVLRMDVMLDDEVLGSIHEPPFIIPFKMKHDRGRAYLKLVVYFKNKTYQAAPITVKPLFIADESEVNLATLRVSATQGFDYLLHLRPMDFVISENNDNREIQNFRRDKAPLRVAILIDTSYSMSGDKLYRAQYAVNAFLSKLDREDLASIYTFDQNVTRLSPFTNKFDEMQSTLLTLSPHHSTSLHEALVQANQDLNKLDGNRVIIVLSDGKDSASVIDKEKVFNQFRVTGSMVYSIVLNLDKSKNVEGKEFLHKLSRMTGSASLEVIETKGLHRSFTKIYNELRSFYLMDFYSSQDNFVLNAINVKVRKQGVKARFSHHRIDAVWQKPAPIP